MPVSIEEDSEFIFEKEHLLKFCNSFLNKDLDSIEIEYLVDCITLSDGVSFENEELNDFLYGMTDFQVNGELTKEKVARVRNSIILLWV